jgi:hypothetical protein
MPNDFLNTGTLRDILLIEFVQHVPNESEKKMILSGSREKSEKLCAILETFLQVVLVKLFLYSLEG